MNARALHVMLVAAAIILPAIAPVPTFAETEKPVWDVQELYKQCKYKGSLEQRQTNILKDGVQARTQE
jgi:hypothetical protein